MREFELEAGFKPKGSQPEAIEKLVEGLKTGGSQTLLGVTGSGKTFTIANVIEKMNRPTLVVAHNKTLAAQLYREFKQFFPKNRVEFFVSYYEYYQPESYLPQKDMYIEKDAKINPKIEQMRLSATASLLSRNDVIVVASVSCIYAAGNPANFCELGFELSEGQRTSRSDIIKNLVRIQFERNDAELMPGRFRVRGDTIDVIPGYSDDIIRIELFGNQVERILEIQKTGGETLERHKSFFFFPAKHFVMTDAEIEGAVSSIESELEATLPRLGPLEAHRLKQRTLFDIEMIREMGYCNGIENYSRHFDGRSPGEKPFCLIDYFPEDFLLVVDESHQTLPQVRGMYNGDRARKEVLVNYGFRLPSALDNRPLKFREFEKYMKNTIFVSATPGDYEREHSRQVVEQIIRPTGLVDPPLFVRPTKGQIDDAISEIRLATKNGGRVLLTTLTKKLAEELSEFLAGKGIRTRYLHSEIDTLERSEIIRELRMGKFDVLVGINLLREGLDIPEVSFIGIFDADKEGFLRDSKSLIQIIGRAARNAHSKVVLYADKTTDSMKSAISETERRRKLQLDYNRKHGIVPKTIIKPIPEKHVEVKDVKHIPKKDVPDLIEIVEKDMRAAAEELDFETAIALRDKAELLKKRLLDRN